MKFLRILAVIMAVAMLSCAFVACDNGGKEDETTVDTTAAAKVTVKLIVKDADGKTVGEEAGLTCTTLGEAIELYCAAKGFEGECFNEQGLLSAIGETTGTGWKAYYEDEGQSKAFDSIKDQVLTDGKTVVVTLK